MRRWRVTGNFYYAFEVSAASVIHAIEEALRRGIGLADIHSVEQI